MNILANRVRTYDGRWKHPTLSAEVMAEAGFYFFHEPDAIKCYACGIKLKNWDINDLPDEEHEKWSPSCPLVIANKSYNVKKKISITLEEKVEIYKKTEPY